MESKTKTIGDYKKEIVRALKANNTYSRALDLQVQSLASALRSLDMANAQIDTLTETTVWEETRYGQKLAPHPVFKIAKEAQELITRQMKILGLTVDDLSASAEDDPLADLTKRLIRRRGQSRVIKPEEPGS